MKIAINFMIILLIVIGGYILPINSNSFGSTASSKEDLNISKPKKVVGLSLEDAEKANKIINPESYEYILNNATAGSTANYTVNVFDSDGNKIATDKFERKFEKTGTIHEKYVIDKDKLNIKYGSYKIDFVIADENSEHEVSRNVFFSNPNIALYKSDREDDMMLAYFSDTSYKMQIPFFRPKVKGSNEFRTVIQTISSPPKIDGILQKPISLPHRIWFSAGVLDLVYNSSSGEAMHGSYLSDVNKTSIIRTYEHVLGTSKVNSIKFFDNQNDPNASTKHDINRKPKVYIPVKINSTDNIFWATYHVNSNEDIDEQSKEIFSKYKTIKASDDKKLSIVPSDVDLISANLENKVLKLNFNHKFENYYKQMDNYLKILIEGLSLSYTSIDGVDAIEIYVENKKIEKIIDFNLSEPIQKPEFFN